MLAACVRDCSGYRPAAKALCGMSVKPGPVGKRPVDAANNNQFTMGHKIVCLTCRKAFSNNLGSTHKFGKCQECGGEYLYFNHKFRPPKRHNIKAWAVVRILRAHGFVYHHINERYVKTRQNGYFVYAEYPTNMKDALAFIDKYKSQVVKFKPVVDSI